MLDKFASDSLAGGWDSALLSPVAEINERLLERLHCLALQRTSVASCTATRRRPLLLQELAEEWRALDGGLQRRVAACPYVLLDAGFAQPQRWEQVPGATVEDAAGATPYFADAEGIALVRRTLLFAWHLARANRLGARVLLGMSPRTAERLSDCRLQQLDAVAERAPGWVVPRWEQQPLIWRQLLAWARRDAPTSLRQAQLRGLQLLAAAATDTGS